MRLKKLEIQGFKSFAYKTEIKIEDGITAIVGPNGSGKSNISDAIRWVLGEQSVKNLRGSKMEDVIFAGTSKKRPLGYCEVTITFDNTSAMIPLDYSEVAVTRRMFRSGESEYYLNKNSCRLRDIRELFMDTGIGKDGYSIIGQGRIDEILSNRPEDRRSIFEEAAGIVKYKTKKIEAERKLEKTEDNIIRIKDLIFELSNQSETLEEQSRKANEFIKFHNKLKELEVNLFIMDIRKLEQEIKKINKEKSGLEIDLKEEILKSKEIEDNFNNIKFNIDKLESKIEEYRNKNLDTKAEIDKNHNELSILKEKEGFYNKDLDRLKKEKELSNDKLKQLQENKLETKLMLDNLNKEYNKLFAIYKLEKEKIDSWDGNLNQLDRQIENEKNNIIKLYNYSSDTRSQLNSIISFNDNIKNRIQQLNKEIDNRKEKSEEIYRKEKNEITSKKNLERELISLNKEFKNKEELMLESRKGLASATEEINNNNNQMGSKLSSLKLLENMEEDYEGYYKGVKSILLKSKTDNKIKTSLIGVVAELIDVDPKYENAIEMALGSNSQNIVTPTEKDAKNLINYLKTNKLGRITCLPNDVIKPNLIHLKESDKNQFNILGLGYELIKFDSKYENIFKYLLGRTIIIEDIDNAINFANKYNHRHRIITLDGEVLNPGGSLSGGSNYKNKVNIINRKNRINKLKVEITNLNNIKIKLEEKKNIYFDQQFELENLLKLLSEKIKDNEYKIIISKNNQDQFLNEISILDQIITRAENDILELKNEKDNYDTKVKELKDLLIDSDKAIEKQKEKIEELTKDFNKKKLDKDEELRNLTDLKINTNEIQNNIKNLEEKLNQYVLEIENIYNNLQDKNDLILFTKENLSDIDLRKSDLVQLVEKLKKTEADTRLSLDTFIQQKNKDMNDFYSEQNNLIAVNKNISSKEKNLNSLDVKFTRNSVQLENYHKRLLDDYELDYQEALKLEITIDNIQESIILVRRLKSNIKELGNVNLSSIEEYKSLKSRLDFILNQQKDLINAKLTLLEVIDDMEIKMTNEFLISFEKINENFKEIFKILFDGGKAELTLSDKDDVLNSGIDINAQPPGKKLQNLSLLSGGEKSLTAVALLFSILNLKPAPFCILDEIDASLDESNINKYTNYLKTLAADTQFVLITHRKTTMEIVDILYGVAMEEEGVSKLISIKLEDYIKEIAS